MRRREFIGAMVAASLAHPAPALAQGLPRPRRVAILMGGGEASIYIDRVAAFRLVLTQLGWREGDNLHVDQ